MPDEISSPDFLALTAEIVAAYIAYNSVTQPAPGTKRATELREIRSIFGLYFK